MKKILSLMIFIIFGSLAFSEIKIEIDNTVPSVNQLMRLVVSFIDEDKKDYKIEGIENFKIMSRGTSNNYHIINGKKTTIKADVYQIMPEKKGKVKIKLSGTDIKSNEIVVDVQEGKTINVSGNMEFKTNISENASYYFGEKILYRDTFITTTQYTSFRGGTTPIFNEFSYKEMTPRDQYGSMVSKHVSTGKGTSAFEVILYEGIIEATSSGKKIIKTGSIEAANTRTGEEFFFGTKDLNVEVLPLPQDRPYNFQNIVGKLEGEQTWNKEKIALGESILLKLRLYGNVNLDQLDNVAKNILSQGDFNVFETVVSANEKIVGDKYFAEKVIEIAIIPRKTGEVTIPTIEIPYFNPKTKEYEKYIIKEKKIFVEGNTSNNQIANNNQGTNVESQQISDNSNQNQVTSATIDSKDNQYIEEIEIMTLSPENGVNQKFYNKYGHIIGIVALLELLTILYLLFKNKKLNPQKKQYISDLKNTKSDKEFYDLYCDIMKEKFDYTPKAHLEDRLIKNGASNEIVAINREIEENIYSGKVIDKHKIIKVLKKELNE